MSLVESFGIDIIYISKYFNIYYYMNNNSNPQFVSFKAPAIFNQKSYYYCPITQKLNPYQPLFPSQHNNQSTQQKLENGKWNNHEQRLYIQFIKEHWKEMQTQFSRKVNKIFKKMSNMVKTRTADQCRSHHQKILKMHSSIENIIDYYQYLFQRISFSRTQKDNLWSTATQQHKNSFYSLSRNGNCFRFLIKESLIKSYIP